jgi:hypothetical protein
LRGRCRWAARAGGEMAARWVPLAALGGEETGAGMGLWGGII